MRFARESSLDFFIYIMAMQLDPSVQATRSRKPHRNGDIVKAVVAYLKSERADLPGALRKVKEIWDIPATTAKRWLGKDGERRKTGRKALLSKSDAFVLLGAVDRFNERGDPVSSRIFRDMVCFYQSK